MVLNGHGSLSCFPVHLSRPIYHLLARSRPCFAYDLPLCLPKAAEAHGVRNGPLHYSHHPPTHALLRCVQTLF